MSNESLSRQSSKPLYIQSKVQPGIYSNLKNKIGRNTDASA